MVKAQKYSISLYCAAIFLTAFAVCANGWEYRPAPETLGFKVNLDLSPFWDGVLAIRQIRIDPCGPVIIEGLSITDRLGRPCLEVESARLQFAKATGWPPKLRHIQVNHPRVTLWLDANGIRLPKGTEHYSTEKLLQYLDLEEATVNNGTFTISNSDFAHTWNDIQFTAQRTDNPNSYNIKLDTENGGNSINVRGAANIKTGSFGLECRTSYLADPNETAGIVRILEIPFFHHFSGRIDTDLNINGSVDGGSLWPVGSIHLSDVSLFTGYGRIANNLEGTLIFSNRRCIFKNLEGESAGGMLDASGYIAVPLDKRASFGGRVSVDGADLKQLMAAMGNPTLFRQGMGSAVYDFTCQNSRLEGLSANGLLFLNDADMWNAPVISHLFRFWNFASSDPLTFSDVAAHFTMSGPVITFQKAELASPLVAIEFEKDATINVANRQVNGYANAVFIRSIGNIIAKIPFMQLFINLKNKLTRVQIHGDWEQPPSQLIHKNVVTDVKQGTIGFFLDSAKSGGQMHEDAVNAFDSLFEASENKTSSGHR